MDKRDGIHLDQVSRIVKEKTQLTWFQCTQNISEKNNDKAKNFNLWFNLTK